VIEGEAIELGAEGAELPVEVVAEAAAEESDASAQEPDAE